MRDPAELEAEYAAQTAPTPPPQRKAKKEVLPPKVVRNPKEMARDIEEPEPREDDPRHHKVWTFEFDHIDPRTKRRYYGLVTNQILNLDQRLNAASLESRLTGGVPYHSIEPVMGNVAKAIAHMTYSIQKVTGASPVGWTDNFLELLDTAPVLQLFQEVLGHEEMFRGLGSDSGGGEEEG